VIRSRRKSGRTYRVSTFDIPQIHTEEFSPVLIELSKLALEVNLTEAEILNLATYAGVRRERGGFYDDREILKMLVKHFREQVYGCVGSDYDEKRRVEKFTRPQVARSVTTSQRQRTYARRKKVAWSGNLLSP
jgi:hypothetical protein